MAKQAHMEEEFLSCYICYDVFKEPKTLTCLHRFCERCLHNYIIGLTAASTNCKRGFPCPVCREFIATPDPKRPPSDWAALLRTDFYLKTLIKFVGDRPELLHGNKAPKIDHPCPTHKNKERDLYCVDCSKIVCHLCAGIAHRGCNQVVTLMEAAEDRRATIEVALQSLSTKLEEVSTFERTRHKFMSHLNLRKCAMEEEIKTWAQDLRHLVTKEESKLLGNLHKKYNLFQDNVSSRVIQLEESVAKVEKHVQTVSSKSTSSSDFDLLQDDSVLKIMKEFQEVDNIDAKQYRTFLKSLSQVKMSFRKSNVPSISVGDIVFSSDRSNEATTQNLTSVGPEASSGVSAANRKDAQSCKYDGASTHISAPSLPKIVHKLQVPFSVVQKERVKPSPPILMNTDFCRSSREKCHSVREPSQYVAQSRNNKEVNSDDSPAISQSKVVLLRTISTRFREDAQDPKLRDLIVISPSNTVLVTDWANQSVKAFHVRREKDSRLTLGGKPWAITQLSDTLAAVSLPLSKQICVIKTTPSLTLQNSFMSAKNYSGLATLNSSMLVASGGSHPPAVDIINLYGEVLKSFANDNSGDAMFEYPAYVSVTPGMLILVSDRKHAALTCMSHSGEIKFRFRPEGSRRLQEPSGVVSDPSGRILAVESRGLLSITSDGKFDRALLSPRDGILLDPRGVALDSDGLVYVTSHESDVKVFTIM